MANDVESEHRSRHLAGLLTSVLLLGTLLAWWGTRDHRRLFGESIRAPIAAGGMSLAAATQEAPVMQNDTSVLDRGYQISQRQCAGCHEGVTRSSAPSYQEIVTFYRRGFHSAAGSPDLRSELALAVTHPRPGWGNFAPGPPESELSPEDRIALASWMLNRFLQTQKAGEGEHN